MGFVRKDIWRLIILKPLKFKLFNIYGNIYLEWYYPCFTYIGSKHQKIIFANILCIAIELQWHSKDCWIEKEEYIGGIQYKTSSKKYPNEKLTEIFLPPMNKVIYYKEK